MRVFVGGAPLGDSVDYVVPEYFDGWSLVSIIGFLTAGAAAETPSMSVFDTNGFSVGGKVSANNVPIGSGQSILWALYGVDTQVALISQTLAIPEIRVQESDTIRLSVSGTGNWDDVMIEFREPRT